MRFLALMFTFFSILVGCIAALLFVILLLRFPPLLVAVLLACGIFNYLLQKAKIPSN